MTSKFEDEVYKYEKIKEQRNQLRSLLEVANQELKELKPNIDNIEKKILKRETELRTQIMYLSERTYKRDINLIRDEMKTLGSEINYNIKSCYSHNRSLFKNKKKEINLKYEIQFKDSTIKHISMLNDLDKEYSVFNKLYITITNENLRIKDNYYKIKEKCLSYKVRYTKMMELIELKNNNKKQLFKRLLYLSKLVDLLKNAINNHQQDNINNDKFKLNMIENDEELNNTNDINDTSIINVIKPNIDDIIKSKVKERRIQNTLASYYNIISYHKKINFDIKTNLIKNDTNNKSYFLTLIMTSISNLKSDKNRTNKELKTENNNLSTDKVSIDDDLIGVEGNIYSKEITTKFSYISKEERNMIMNFILNDPLVLKIYKSKKLIN